MKCQYCQQEAVYHRKISNEYVCKIHFIISIEKKIQKTVRKYQLFSPKDTIAVGISGGKDSLAVLHNVLKIRTHRQSQKPIFAILIDEGIKGYREESSEIAREFCSKMNIPLHIVKFEDEFGASLDDAVKKAQRLDFNACTICGTVRRRLLNDKAKELGADVLVIGHNLDDVSETFLQNILRNDLKRILQHPPWGNEKDESGHFIPRIKPLMEIPENEITLYCYFMNFPIQTTPCPYVEPYFILREQVQKFLNTLEGQSAEIKYNLLRMQEKLMGTILEKDKGYEVSAENIPKDQDIYAIQKLCSQCHQPTGSARQICYYCELKQVLEL